ncbi:MAG: ATP-binding cassette domain-containing protein [Polyangiales bacterium]
MSARARHRMLVPEVVQTSAMDCGPASLKALLEGFGIPVSYGRLREACQTEVDGTSIDALEEVARRIGLDATQRIVPEDHLALPESHALPAIVVVQLPGGLTHFVVVWRVHLLGGPFDRRGLVQIMDPAGGRRWVSLQRFQRELYRHVVPVPASAWREHAAAPDGGFAAPLRRRLAALGFEGDCAPLRAAEADPTCAGLAALDAAVRMTTALVVAGAVDRGAAARQMVAALAEEAARSFGEPATDGGWVVPRSYWSTWPAPDDDDGEPRVYIAGAVVVSIAGLLPHAPRHGREAVASSEGPLPVEVVEALRGEATPPLRGLLRLLREDGALVPAALLAATLVAAAAAVGEAVLFRALFDLARRLGGGDHRGWALAAVVLFLATIFALELPLQRSLQRVGRQLENRLRVAFLRKVPRLGDRYFSSRTVSDMTERSHAVHQLRALPALSAQLLRACAALALTTLGLAWVAPGLAVPAVLAAALSIVIPLAAQPPLAEMELRFRAHGGALARFYLDALLGVTAVRTHGAERAIRREHEALMVSWVGAARSLLRASVTLEGAEALVGLGLATALLVGPFADPARAGSVLLVAYWALAIPALGAEVSQLARQYPDHRNVALRLLEPLDAPEDDTATPGPLASDVPGVALHFEGVTLRAAGRDVLVDVELSVAPGEHVAIVGASGAGKSSLVGALLGWYAPSAGVVRVDGEALVGPRLAALRLQTVWIDPSVHLWNRSLLENLSYGGAQSAQDFAGALRDADLRGVLERLPDGLQTSLGEGGARVSGGEGQRVRVGRGLLRATPRLVVLDEPLRGLDRGQRGAMLDALRARWHAATLLCVTHDVRETLRFARVLVVDQGRIVEDGDPSELAAREDSRYRALLDAEDRLRAERWGDPAWRRWRMGEGVLAEAPR